MKSTTKHIHLAVTNDLVSDNRVHRIATTLSEMGFAVTLTGRRLPHSPLLSNRNYNTRRMQLLFRKGMLFYAEYNIRLFLYLLFSRYDIIVANDLDTLPACALAASLKRKLLIYDSHEYFTEVPELVHRPRVKHFWERLERFFIRKVDAAYTVCASIAAIYRKKYEIPFQVVRNLPALNSTSPKQSFLLNIPANNKKIVLYQGALNIGRGLEKMINAMKFMPDAVLIIAGDGDLREQLHQLVNDKQLSDRVHFTGRLPLEQLASLTKMAHLGLSLEEDLGLNYRYALPNKLFDYISSEIPVLCSSLPEMKKIVDDYRIGCTISPDSTTEELAKKISEMLNDAVNQPTWKKNLQKAAKELTWEQESKVIETIYRVYL